VPGGVRRQSRMEEKGGRLHRVVLGSLATEDRGNRPCKRRRIKTARRGHGVKISFSGKMMGHLEQVHTPASTEAAERLKDQTHYYCGKWGSELIIR